MLRFLEVIGDNYSSYPFTIKINGLAFTLKHRIGLANIKHIKFSYSFLTLGVRDEIKLDIQCDHVTFLEASIQKETKVFSLTKIAEKE